MKLFQRQEGYTLLLTLVLVVLLFLLTASFSIASMNQTKQISKTDGSFTSISLAEMGVEYYSDSLQTKIANLISRAKFEVTQIEKNMTLSPAQKDADKLAKVNEYNTLINTEVVNFLNTESAPAAKRIVDTDSRAYKIQSYTKQEVTDSNGYVKVNLTVTVAGLMDQVAKNTIDMKMTYPKLSVPLVNGLPSLPSLTFEEYKDKYLSDPTKVTQVSVPTISNPGFEFKDGMFYYFPISITFDSQQFNSEQNRDLASINVLAADGVFFLRHVRIYNSYLKVKTISFTFSSNAKSDIISSTLVTDTISFSTENTNGNSVKEEDKRVNLVSSNVCIENSLTSTGFNSVKLAFKHSQSTNYKVIYKLSSDSNEQWYQMDSTADKTAIAKETKETICSLKVQDPNGIIDPGTSVDEIKYN